MVKFMNWAQGILTLQPGAAAFVAEANPIFKVHLLLGMTIFLLSPFTRLVPGVDADLVSRPHRLSDRAHALVRTPRGDGATRRGRARQ